jgi:hypothetical protein
MKFQIAPFAIWKFGIDTPHTRKETKYAERKKDRKK